MALRSPSLIEQYRTLTGVALAGDVEVVGLVLREPLEPVEQEHVSVISCIRT